MKIRNLVWDEWNIEHVSRHSVTRDEKDKMAVWGQTESGRYLLVILGIRGFDDYYSVSARDMDQREKKNFRKWIKRYV